MTKEKMISVYMTCAENFAKLSYAERKKVGAVVVTPEDVMLYSWNGTASGDDNTCEDKIYLTDIGSYIYSGRIITLDYPYTDSNGNFYQLVTKPTVLHAERNIIAKAAKEGISLKGASLFVTMSCCLECALMICQAGIKEVYYREEYRCLDGIKYLKDHGIHVEQI